MGAAPARAEAVTEAMAAAAVTETVTPQEEAAAADPYGTCYEIFVYSFCDSDGDGTGDLNGVAQKLDYIGDGDADTTDDLGCDRIWLMPVFPSPTYHKYDVTDYTAIDPAYGTMEDFEALLAACHERGIVLILDLPVNHTSSQHPWFMEAAAYLQNLSEGSEPDAEACPYVDYYHFSRTPADGYARLDEAGLDLPADGGSEWYYEARFWSGMPDLNLDSEAVRAELTAVMKFWLDKGVDGFRLDAVTSYYTGDQQANIDFMSWLYTAAAAIREDVYMVGEAWAAQEIYAAYYESGIDSLFDFAFAGEEGIIASVVRGTKPASAYVQALADEEALYDREAAAAGENGSAWAPVNAPFYTNHDMARSAGYYAYDDGSRTKLSGALNLLMTGCAYVYYGEELGMKGAGKDVNKRLPMYWSRDAGAGGMCDGPADADAVSMKFESYEEQKDDEMSVYRYYRQAIRLREQFPVIARGRTEVVDACCSRDIGTFLRTDAEGDYESVAIVINTSAYARQIDLRKCAAGAYMNLAASLNVSEDEPIMAGNTLTVPAFGVVVLTQ